MARTTANLSSRAWPWRAWSRPTPSTRRACRTPCSTGSEALPTRRQVGASTSPAHSRLRSSRLSYTPGSATRATMEMASAVASSWATVRAWARGGRSLLWCSTICSRAGGARCGAPSALCCCTTPSATWSTSAEATSSSTPCTRCPMASCPTRWRTASCSAPTRALSRRTNRTKGASTRSSRGLLSRPAATPRPLMAAWSLTRRTAPRTSRAPEARAPRRATWCCTFRRHCPTQGSCTSPRRPRRT
mmetsp:Transcript_29446/g.69353  ORF Transcript_29446/g.69353 Transcript_29446/m.69353 type:complete len:246 (+) Transcript_29446:797-1534(+)